MDDADITSEREEYLLRNPEKKPEGPRPTGLCLFCGEPLVPGLRWCNKDCRNDWQYEQDHKKG